MKKYKDFKSFNRNFDLTREMMQQLVAEGEKAGVSYQDEDFQKSEPLIKLQLKALIARDLWNMNEYYQTMNLVNESVKKAVELLEKDVSLVRNK